MTEQEGAGVAEGGHRGWWKRAGERYGVAEEGVGGRGWVVKGGVGESGCGVLVAFHPPPPPNLPPKKQTFAQPRISLCGGQPDQIEAIGLHRRIWGLREGLLRGGRDELGKGVVGGVGGFLPAQE